MKLGAAPEIDRHTLQLSEPPPRHGCQSARHELFTTAVVHNPYAGDAITAVLATHIWISASIRPDFW